MILIRLSAAFSLTIALVMSSVTSQAEEACDKPVDMVILSIVHDVARYQAYRSSLIELGTLEAFGGLVISVATRLEFEPEILEGGLARRSSFLCHSLALCSSGSCFLEF